MKDSGALLMEAAEAFRDAAAAQELLLRMGQEHLASVDLSAHPELEDMMRVARVSIRVSESTIAAWNRVAVVFEKLAQEREDE